MDSAQVPAPVRTISATAAANSSDAPSGALASSLRLLNSASSSPPILRSSTCWFVSPVVSQVARRYKKKAAPLRCAAGRRYANPRQLLDDDRANHSIKVVEQAVVRVRPFGGERQAVALAGEQYARVRDVCAIVGLAAETRSARNEPTRERLTEDRERDRVRFVIRLVEPRERRPYRDVDGTADPMTVQESIDRAVGRTDLR